MSITHRPEEAEMALGSTSPRPYVVAKSGDAAAAPAGAVDIALYGAGGGGPALATTAPAAPAVTAAVGVGTTAARADHVHARQTGAQVALTGYTIGTVAKAPVAAADSANAAIAKLEKRIADLEAAAV